jgi:hypothetical protein
MGVKSACKNYFFVLNRGFITKEKGVNGMVEKEWEIVD